jgi:putative phage-type endonuclease
MQTEVERKAWLEERRKGIGASDAAAACGLSKWMTPLQLYLDKIGEGLPVDETADMRWGTLKEGVVFQEWCTRHDMFGEKPPAPAISTRWLFARANLDGLAMPRTSVPGDVRSMVVVEVKCARSDAGWGEPGTDEVPETYRIQALHQMAVCEWADRVEFAVLIGASDYREYTVMRDDAAIESLMAIEARFWQRVLDRDPPPPTTAEDVALLFPRSLPAAIQANDAIVAKCAALVLAKKALREAEKSIREVEDEIKVFMGGCEKLEVGDTVLATFKSGTRKGYVVQPTETRTFLLKGHNDN